MRNYLRAKFLDTWFGSLERFQESKYGMPDLSLLKSSYRKLSLLNHPDKCDDCEGEMANINTAYEFIKDNFGIGVEYHRNALSECVNKTVPFFDMDIAGNEDIVGDFLSDFGISLY